MKQQESKPLIIQQWDQWVQTQSIEPRHASARDSFKFFLELEDAQSPLLNFQPRGRDKWQTVHDWLLNEGRVLNCGSPSSDPAKSKDLVLKRKQQADGSQAQSENCLAR
jgi:hypothetical protein